jgi:recombination protein RecA
MAIGINLDNDERADDDRADDLPAKADAKADAAAKAAAQADAHRKKLEALLDKNFGKGRGRTFANQVVVPIPRASTGSIGGDWAMDGGIPYGRITEIYGVEGGGKTTFAVSVLGQIQRETGADVAFIDAEFGFDPLWAKKLGVDIDRLWFDQPDYGEQGLELAETYIASGAIRGVVVDSVSALIPKSELDGEMTDASMGTQARMMSKAMRRLLGLCSHHGVALIFINQIRMKIGVTFGSPETRSGGQALKYASSLVLDIRKGETTKSKDGDEFTSGTMKISVKKNRGASQGRKCLIPIRYGRGLDLAGEVVDLGADAGLIQKSGAWYSYQGERIGQGREAAIRWMRQHPAVHAALAPQLVQYLGSLPQTDDEDDA